MQKLAKRTAQAQRQAARRADLMAGRERADMGRRNRDVMKKANQEVKDNLRAARKARREDWEMGPLAPKRDLGFNGYGVISEQMRVDYSNNGMNSVNPGILRRRCEWAGGVKQLNLAPEDRVVILEGPDKGKVDRIKSIDLKHGTVTLQEYHKGLYQGFLGIGHSATQVPISIGAIRLVYPITHPTTGVTKDTIVRQLKAVPPDMQSENMTFDRWEHGKKWDRLVPGINVVIPWPDVKAPEYETHDADTARDQVEDRSFYYNLLSPPMPTQILDELRNKYSRFRTRHEHWYLAKKEAEAAAKKNRHEMLRSMQTPMDELREQNQQLKDARGEPELTDEMLQKLGEIIAQTKAASLEDAGVTEVTSKSDPSEERSNPPQQ